MSKTSTFGEQTNRSTFTKDIYCKLTSMTKANYPKGQDAK